MMLYNKIIRRLNSICILSCTQTEVKRKLFPLDVGRLAYRTLIKLVFRCTCGTRKYQIPNSHWYNNYRRTLPIISYFIVYNNNVGYVTLKKGTGELVGFLVFVFTIKNIIPTASIIISSSCSWVLLCKTSAIFQEFL